MIQLGLNRISNQRSRVEEKYDYPVLTLIARKDEKGTASKLQFNKAAYVALELCDHSRLIISIEEIDGENKAIIFDGRKLGPQADNLKRRFAKTDMSFSNKKDYDELLKYFIIEDDTVDTEFKMAQILDANFLGVDVKVGVLELIDSITTETTEDTTEDVTSETTEEVESESNITIS